MKNNKKKSVLTWKDMVIIGVIELAINMVPVLAGMAKDIMKNEEIKSSANKDETLDRLKESKISMSYIRDQCPDVPIELEEPEDDESTYYLDE